MFNVGGGEIIVVLLLALVVLGPDKLPEAARKAGKFMHEFRRMTSGFQEEVRSAMDLGSLTTKSKDNALDRTTPGPRLAPESPSAPTAPPVANTGSPKTFAADVVQKSAGEPLAPGSVSDES
jgi:sec-independent protein translocase protein TatB